MSGRSEKLLDAIGMVEDGLVAEAHGDFEGAGGARELQAKRTSWARRAIAAAACLVVIAGVGALALGVFDETNMVADLMEADVGSAAVEAKSSGSADAVDEGLALNGLAADAEVAYEEAATSYEMAATADGPSSLVVGAIEEEQGYEDEVEVEAGLLTAAEWNDNDNWPFFTNLVNAGTVSFPSFGIDPRYRTKVTVTDGSGNPVQREPVVLRDGAGEELWHATTDKRGVAYLFCREGESPASVAAPGSGAEQALATRKGGGQGGQSVQPGEDVGLSVSKPSAEQADGVQVMFIVDTTGSMSDEIAYLQADFSSIAADAGAEGVSYSANFYRDEGDEEEYVTKCNSFTDDIVEVQRQLNGEYADGGGDEPEAVAQILREAITDNASWRDSAAKIAFLVFDAPPHEGTEDTLDAAVRSAARRGIRIVPVVASNASRETELFGRAIAVCTDAPYVFLTDDSGIGDAHLEPIIGDYQVEPLHDIIVRLIRDAR